MSCITLVNMKKGVVLHKLILLELVLAYWQAFNLFFTAPIYGWWLSSAAVLLHSSTSLHNVIAWLKLRPFLGPRTSRLFIGTVILAQPYWVLDVYGTFAFFNNLEHADIFPRIRPFEALFRDPWWVAACVGLVLSIGRSGYELTLFQVVRASPRFAIMLAAMALSIVCIVLDVLSAARLLSDALPVGVNPFWKLALVFKCLTDTVILDDFKTALDRLWSVTIAAINVDSVEAAPTAKR